jgi:hypothetical protein
MISNKPLVFNTPLPLQFIPINPNLTPQISSLSYLLFVAFLAQYNLYPHGVNTNDTPSVRVCINIDAQEVDFIPTIQPTITFNILNEAAFSNSTNPAMSKASNGNVVQLLVEFEGYPFRLYNLRETKTKQISVTLPNPNPHHDLMTVLFDCSAPTFNQEESEAIQQTITLYSPHIPQIHYLLPARFSTKHTTKTEKQSSSYINLISISKPSLTLPPNCEILHLYPLNVISQYPLIFSQLYPNIARTLSQANNFTFPHIQIKFPQNVYDVDMTFVQQCNLDYRHRLSHSPTPPIIGQPVIHESSPKIIPSSALALATSSSHSSDCFNPHSISSQPHQPVLESTSPASTTTTTTTPFETTVVTIDPLTTMTTTTTITTTTVNFAIADGSSNSNQNTAYALTNLVSPNHDLDEGPRLGRPPKNPKEAVKKTSKRNSNLQHVEDHSLLGATLPTNMINHDNLPPIDLASSMLSPDEDEMTSFLSKAKGPKKTTKNSKTSAKQYTSASFDMENLSDNSVHNHKKFASQPSQTPPLHQSGYTKANKLPLTTELNIDQVITTGSQIINNLQVPKTLLELAQPLYTIQPPTTAQLPVAMLNLYSTELNAHQEMMEYLNQANDQLFLHLRDGFKQQIILFQQYSQQQLLFHQQQANFNQTMTNIFNLAQQQYKMEIFRSKFSPLSSYIPKTHKRRKSPSRRQLDQFYRCHAVAEYAQEQQESLEDSFRCPTDKLQDLLLELHSNQKKVVPQRELYNCGTNPYDKSLDAPPSQLHKRRLQYDEISPDMNNSLGNFTLPSTTHRSSTNPAHNKGKDQEFQTLQKKKAVNSGNHDVILPRQTTNDTDKASLPFPARYSLEMIDD